MRLLLVLMRGFELFLIIVIALLEISWFIMAIMCFIEYRFWEALGNILFYSIFFAIIYGIICLVVYFLEKCCNFIINKIFIPLDKINALFADERLSYGFDFSEYTEYSDVDTQKNSLSLVYNIDFNVLQYRADSPISQNFFTESIKQLNKCNKIYDLLKIIAEKEKLFLKNTTEKQEISKIAWSLRGFIKIKLEERNKELIEWELDEEQYNTTQCIYALQRYFKDLKMQQTIEKIGLNNIQNVVMFCKKGEWNNFIQNLKIEDRERLEMLILKDIYKNCLEFHEIDIFHSKRIIGNKILKTLEFKDFFKTDRAIYFFELLAIYLKAKQDLEIP